MTTASSDWPANESPRPEGVISAALFDLLMRIPASSEMPSDRPDLRAHAIGQSAARRAAATSGALALPPGPIGWLTVVPDLIAIWRIQQQMVVDIAATFGRQAQLRREVMIYCLFKHGGAALMRDLVARVGERVLVREASLRTVQRQLEKIGVRVTQKIISRNLTRWIPVLGAVGTGAFAYYDTKQVATTAIAFFAQSDEDGIPPLPPVLTIPPELPPSTS